MNNSYVQQYSKVGMETGVASADPHRLVLMLFEGAITAITFAKVEMQRQNYSAKGEGISKAISIIGELDGSLNFEAGGTLAENLRNLYEFMSIQLVEANLQNNEKRLDQVIQLLTELKLGWVGITEDAKKMFQEKGRKVSEEAVSYGTI